MRLVFLAFFITLGALVRPAAATVPPEVAARVVAATLTVRAADGRAGFLGSAFLFGAPDRAITNAHVVERARTVTVVTQSGRTVRAVVIAVDPARDLALLALEEPLGAPLLPGGKTAPGQTVLAAGAPLEAGFSLTAGIVSALDRQIDPTQAVRYVQHAAPVNPGSSGGPLVNVTGQVVGVNARIADGSRFFVGIAYAVPVADLAAFVANGPLPKRAATGLHLRPIGPRIRAALGHSGPGVLVEQVRAGSPAAEAGLQAGDILTRVGAQVMHDPGALAFALAEPDALLRAEIVRGGVASRVTLDLSPLPGAGVAAGGTPQRRGSYKLTDMGLVLDPDGTIRAVVSEGAGFFAGLSGGDVIEAVDGTLIVDLGFDWITEFTFAAPILLRIALAQGGTRHYVLDPWEDPVGVRLASGANMVDRDVVVFDGQ
ncbi:MAG: trypsin-like peptidase domain-containing protein [Pseudomonadota bacterium]